MTYRVEMIRSPGLSDEEVRRRLYTVYSLLIRLGREHKKTADDVKVDGPPSSAADDAAQERSAVGSVAQ